MIRHVLAALLLALGACSLWQNANTKTGPWYCTVEVKDSTNPRGTCSMGRTGRVQVDLATGDADACAQAVAKVTAGESAPGVEVTCLRCSPAVYTDTAPGGGPNACGLGGAPSSPSGAGGGAAAGSGATGPTGAGATTSAAAATTSANVGAGAGNAWSSPEAGAP